MSDDGQDALTIIAFIGSVFSPYYAVSRRRGHGDPLDHCALNVALYGPGGKRWALTERTRHDLERSNSTLTIGPSALSWDGDTLTISIDEWTVPIPSRIKGTVRVRPRAFVDDVIALDRNGRHGWLPIAPRARIEVALDHPKLRWNGEGYLDSNFGEEPLERAFKRWQWSRAHTSAGTVVLYDVERRDGTTLSVAREFDGNGHPRSFEPPPVTNLPTTGWRIPRQTRSEKAATLIRTLEDTPFYARSVIETRLCGGNVTSVHESLSLDRFANPGVQMMLPFRMPRRRFRRSPQIK